MQENPLNCKASKTEGERLEKKRKAGRTTEVVMGGTFVAGDFQRMEMSKKLSST